MKVVVIDDSVNVRKHLIALLKTEPEIDVVGEARDVQEGIEVVDQLKPDAVILDISMPGGSGIDVLRHIRREAPPTIVLILTNYHFPQYRDICMNMGADYFFDKSGQFQLIGETLVNHFPKSARRGAAV